MPKKKGQFKGFGFKMKSMVTSKAVRSSKSMVKHSTFLKSQSPVRTRGPKRSAKRAGT